MGWAERVTRPRACRHNCLLKVERTAKELRDHAALAHNKLGAGYQDPEPSTVPALETNTSGLLATLLASPLAHALRRKRR